MRKVIFLMLFSLFLMAYNSVEQKILFIKTIKLADQGYSKKALNNINLLLKNNPNNPQYLLLKGKILKDLKKFEKAKIVLKEVLDIEPDNIMARKLLSDIEEIENMSENDIIRKALDWLNNKGVDLLFMFLGVLGSELLMGAFNECKKEKTRDIKDFVNKTLGMSSIKENIGCYFINLLIVVTVSLVVTIVILFAVLLINPPFLHLNFITQNKFWVMVFEMYAVICFVICLFFVYKNKKSEISVEDVALILMKFYETKEYDKLKEELLEISKLPQDYVKKIFENIFYEDIRKKIEKFYGFIKKER